MEALEFFKEARRMCLSKNYCVDCEFRKSCTYTHRPCDMVDEMFEKAIAYVEKWSKEHPIITNAKKFEEVFGFLPDGDVIFSKDYFINAVKGPVLKWDEPYKEPEHED